MIRGNIFREYGSDNFWSRTTLSDCFDHSAGDGSDGSQRDMKEVIDPGWMRKSDFAASVFIAQWCASWEIGLRRGSVHRPAVRAVHAGGNLASAGARWKSIAQTGAQAHD